MSIVARKLTSVPGNPATWTNELNSILHSTAKIILMRGEAARAGRAAHEEIGVDALGDEQENECGKTPLGVSEDGNKYGEEKTRCPNPFGQEQFSRHWSRFHRVSDFVFAQNGSRNNAAKQKTTR